MILDATASHRAMWLDKTDPEAVFIDQRKEVKPDIVCCWQYLPFKNAVFDVDNFDPPHILYQSKGKPSQFNLTEKYGCLEPETWPKDLYIAFEELMRVLMPHGTLLFKWNDNHISNKRMLAVLPIKPKFGSQVRESRGFKNKISKEPRSVTSWFCFTRRSYDAYLEEGGNKGVMLTVDAKDIRRQEVSR